MPEALKEIADNGPEVEIERCFPKPWGERTESEKEEYDSAPIRFFLLYEISPVFGVNRLAFLFL